MVQSIKIYDGIVGTDIGLKLNHNNHNNSSKSLPIYGAILIIVYINNWHNWLIKDRFSAINSLLFNNALILGGPMPIL